MIQDASTARGAGEGRASGRPIRVFVLVAALALQGLSGLMGGTFLALDPTGASLGIPVGWLEGSPFDDYLIPGVVLLSVLGIVPLGLAYGVWTRRPWSWTGSLLLAVALFVWLGVEIAAIGYRAQPPLQLIYGIVGAVILWMTVHPSVRKDLASR